MRHTIHTLCISAIFAIATIPSSHADELADKGRDIFSKYSHAVVTVEAVQKMTATDRSSRARETKLDVTGTVVDASGLTVASLSTLDPMGIYKKISGESKAEVELSEVKILLEDGTEIPAEIVLRDEDFDLAYIRPKAKPAAPMTAIDLGKNGPAQLLEPLVTLNRLKRVAGRAFSASVERISAVVQKPRTFYVPENGASQTTLGSPAFTMNGDIVGIFVMRAVSSQGGANLSDCLSGIILPAADIEKNVTQALQAKSEDAAKPAAKAPSNDPTIPAK
jgi:S1-C subfamily serine protease